MGAANRSQLGGSWGYYTPGRAGRWVDASFSAFVYLARPKHQAGEILLWGRPWILGVARWTVVCQSVQCGQYAVAQYAPLLLLYKILRTAHARTVLRLPYRNTPARTSHQQQHHRNTSRVHPIPLHTTTHKPHWHTNAAHVP